MKLSDWLPLPSEWTVLPLWRLRSCSVIAVGAVGPALICEAVEADGPLSGKQDTLDCLKGGVWTRDSV